jgi:hypothetical protein
MNAPSPPADRSATSAADHASKGQFVALALSWTAVGLPLLWGVVETLRKTFALFQ